MTEIKSIINENELAFIARCVLDYKDMETGGDFFGHWTKGGPNIMYVTGPGKNTTRTSISFYQDIPYLHKCGNIIHTNWGLEHIGSWHSHHNIGLNYPSSGDVNTMRNLLNTQTVDKFFISICNIISSDIVSINGFLFCNTFKNFYKETMWAILPDSSPYRKSIDEKASFITYPKTKKAKFKVEQTRLYPNKIVVLSDKVDLPQNSFFSTEEGRMFLRNEYNRFKENIAFSNVELIQNEDKTIGITFNYDCIEYEIRFPIDFSKENPILILVKKEAEKEIKHHINVTGSSRINFLLPFDLYFGLDRILQYPIKLKFN